MMNRFLDLIGTNQVIDGKVIDNWLQDQIVTFGDEETTLKVLISALEKATPDQLDLYLYEPEEIDPHLLEGIEIPENLSGVETFRLCLLHILKKRLQYTEPN